MVKNTCPNGLYVVKICGDENALYAYVVVEDDRKYQCYIKEVPLDEYQARASTGIRIFSVGNNWKQKYKIKSDLYLCPVFNEPYWELIFNKEGLPLTLEEEKQNDS